MIAGGGTGRRGRGAALPGGRGHEVAFGITDLMTSLAIIFVLLLAVFAAETPAERPPQPPLEPPRPDATREALSALTRLGLVLETDAADPHVLRLVAPESLLNFEFGQSALTAPAERFLREVMPVYARTMCGALRGRVAGVVIEGHTDDLGGDEVNLRLSQERSFRVLVRGLEAILDADPADHGCFAALASASGRGKQDLVYDAGRRPDRAASRRVVFKILLRPPGLDSG